MKSTPETQNILHLINLIHEGNLTKEEVNFFVQGAIATEDTVILKALVNTYPDQINIEELEKKVCTFKSNSHIVDFIYHASEVDIRRVQDILIENQSFDILILLQNSDKHPRRKAKMDFKLTKEIIIKQGDPLTLYLEFTSYCIFNGKGYDRELDDAMANIKDVNILQNHLTAHKEYISQKNKEKIEAFINSNKQESLKSTTDNNENTEEGYSAKRGTPSESNLPYYHGSPDKLKSQLSNSTQSQFKLPVRNSTLIEDLINKSISNPENYGKYMKIVIDRENLTEIMTYAQTILEEVRNADITPIIEFITNSLDVDTMNSFLENVPSLSDEDRNIIENTIKGLSLIL